MKKINSVKDITSGMLVTLRDGTKMTVVTTTLYGNMDKCCTGLSLFGPGVDADGADGYWPMTEYDSDFKCKHKVFSGPFDEYDDDGAMKIHLPDLDIVQVWSCTCPSNAFANTTEDRELLWSDPSYKTKGWDELTEEEKNTECDKHEDCRDCPYDNKGCNDFDFDADPDDEPCGDCKPDPTADVGEPEAEDADDVANLLDELREECKDNPLAMMIFLLHGGDLPEDHIEYVLGKTDKNPARKAAGHSNKSLAEQLYEKDKELANEGVSIVERDLALLAAMHKACGDHKE